MDGGAVRSRALRWGAGLAIVAVVVVGATLLLRPRGVVVRLAEATHADVLSEVRCDGTLEAPAANELRAAEGGRVADLAVRDGERVHAGQLLLRLDNPELESARRQAEATVLRLRAEGVAGEAAREKAKCEVAHWRQVVAADRRLVAEQAATRAELEADEMALVNAEADERAAQAHLSSLRGPSSQQRLARDAVTDAAGRVSALSLRAPADGLVFGLPARTGLIVEKGHLVASIAESGRTRVKLHVDQPDLPRINVGQRLVVSFSGLPDEHWDGEVTRVAPVLQEAGGREVGEVVGEISDPRGILPLNASVDARIVLNAKHGVLAVPRAALYRDGDSRFVYVLRAGRATRRTVTIGLVGLNDVEITGGLVAGERVVLAAEVPLKDGLRVAPAS